MDEATFIQLAFPSEPQWPDVSNAVLVQLVKTHDNEPSCAQSALYQLRARSHPETEDLCCALLSSERADQWLRAGALGILLSINPLRGFDIATGFIDKCESELLEELIVALNYEHQGELKHTVHQHPIVQGVRRRLAQASGSQTEFGSLFIERFGG